MKEIELKRADGSKRTVSGYLYAAPPAGTAQYATKKIKEERLPSKVDLRPYMTYVEDQGQIGSCTANAVAGAYEYLAKQHLGDDSYDVSRLFIYYNGRYLNGDQNEACGSIISKAIESLKEYGACSETTWPYSEDLVLEQPSQEAYDEAANFLVENTELIPTDLYSWKHALAEGYPIIFGIALFDSFDKQKKRGLVPLPTNQETTRQEHGAHAMLCVGYSDTDKVFIVRNSWGENWGDKGYCYIPYSYIINDKFNLGDSWIIRQLENINFNEENWGDDTSVLMDLGTALSEMTDEQYNDMLDDLGDWSLEYRIGLLVLRAAGSDGEISDDEYAATGEYMQRILELIGSELDGEEVLRYCYDGMQDDDLINESIELLGKHLSARTLATIIVEIGNIANVDDITEEEENFAAELIAAWQIEDDVTEILNSESSDVEEE